MSNNPEVIFGILAYPLFPNKELMIYNGKSRVWWCNIGQRYRLKKEIHVK